MALKLAVDDPKKRKNFYNYLFESDIYLITNNNDLPQGEITLSDDTQISIIQIKNQMNQVVFPFFSSPEHISRITDDNTISYIKINIQVFLRMIKCAPCILNPGSEYSKEFTADELIALFDGSLLNNISQHTISAGEKLLIGQPNIEPTKLIKILRECFSKYKTISESYIAQMFHEGDSVDSHIIVAVKATGELNEIFHDATSLIESMLGQGMIVDFVDLSKSKDFNDLFQKIKPFYKRMR